MQTPNMERADIVDSTYTPVAAGLARRLRIFRYVASAILLCIFIDAVADLPLKNFSIGYTQWGLIMTLCVFSMLSVCSSGIVQTERRFKHFAYTCFEVAWCAEFVITVFFWLVLFVVAIASGSKKTVSLSTILYNLVVHTLPMLFLLIDNSMNPVIFMREHLGYCFLPFAPYLAISLIYAYAWDTTLYQVINYRDLLSLEMALLVVGLTLLGFYVGHRLSIRKLDAHK